MPSSKTFHFYYRILHYITRFFGADPIELIFSSLLFFCCSIKICCWKSFKKKEYQYIKRDDLGQKQHFCTFNLTIFCRAFQSMRGRNKKNWENWNGLKLIASVSWFHSKNFSFCWLNAKEHEKSEIHHTTFIFWKNVF